MNFKFRIGRVHRLLAVAGLLSNFVLVAALASPAAAQTCTASPANPSNGSYGNCSGFTAGQSCSLVCSPGYTQAGANPTCVSGTTWNGSPTCQPNPCSGPPASVSHGSYDSCATVPSGSTCNLTCDGGYQQVGPDPTCTLGAYGGPAPSCQAVSCTASPSSPANGQYGNCAGAIVGQTCSLGCNPGYTRSGANPTCVGGTTWNGSPTCSANPCSGPPAPVAHGSYDSCTSVASGSACELTCDAGYTQSGVEQTCTLGAYSGPAPACIPNPCSGPPSPVANGSYDSCTSVASGSTCELTCDAGYTQAGVEQTCALGVYGGSAPTCDPDPCSGPPVPVANGSYDSCTSVASGSTCELTCDAGYTESGTEQTCALGIYTGPAPTCDPNPCSGPPVPVAHGNYDSCTSVASGSTCELTCDAGYTQAGTEQVCSLGIYGGSAPTCDPNSCVGPPAPVAHGSYASCATVPSGSTCELTCDSGSLETGTEQTCVLGVYSGPAPACDPLCGAVPATGCRQVASGSSLVLVKDKTDDAGDQLKWKWAKGDATDLADFGDPVSGSGEYALCVYDASAALQPLSEMIVAPGGICGSAPCWSATGDTGYLYKDKAGLLGGVQMLKLKAAAPDKASIQMKAGTAALPTPALPVTAPVTVQFVATDAGTTKCWQSVFSAGLTNENGVLKGKLP